MSHESVFYVEVLKLLSSVAWSDGQVDVREQEWVLRLAAEWHVPGEALASIEESLRSGRPLPPDIRVLRERPADVLQAVRALASADDRVDGWEQSMLMQISAMLGVALG